MSKFSLLVFLGLGIISSAFTFSIQALSKSYEVTQTFIQPLPSKEANLTLTLLPRPSPSQTAFLSPFPSITPSKVASPILPPSLSSLRIAFTNNKKLWFWQNGKAEPLTDLEGYARVNISDDGKIIAFARDKGLWAINTDGSNEHILVTANDFKLMEPKDPGVALNQLDWIPETHKLLFNTIVLASYGLSYADDLYRVNADTMQLAMLRKPGKGGRFIISPDGKRVALVTPSQISVMKVDGSNNRMLLGYSVPSGSEAAYYTQPVWASDSQSLTVAIPPDDFFMERHYQRIFGVCQ